jgi:hypothetical protein
VRFAGVQLDPHLAGDIPVYLCVDFQKTRGSYFLGKKDGSPFFLGRKEGAHPRDLADGNRPEGEGAVLQKPTTRNTFGQCNTSLGYVAAVPDRGNRGGRGETGRMSVTLCAKKKKAVSPILRNHCQILSLLGSRYPGCVLRCGGRNVHASHTVTRQIYRDVAIPQVV